MGVFLATGDPAAALANFRANSTFPSEEGETKAHTFHWIDNLAALGVIDTTVTANHPLAVVFKKNGARTYVASNVTTAALTVTYSDGTRLTVGPGKTATGGAISWSGGSASGGSPGGTTSSSATPTSASATSASPTPAPQSPSRSFGAGGVLTDRADLGKAFTLHSADGATHDGTPYQPSVFTASGLSLGYRGGSTSFALTVDSGASVGNGVQIRMSYDLTGNGSWDRVETYRYFATDPVPGAERYTQNAGVVRAGVQLGDLSGGRVQVEIWSALPGGSNPPTVGAESSVMLPFS